MKKRPLAVKQVTGLKEKLNLDGTDNFSVFAATSHHA
jgi:hypothetical protein